MPKTTIARAVVAALIGAVALALSLGSAIAQPFLDTLVTGTITGATGGTVTVTSDGADCQTVAGGTVASDGTYQVVVKCGTGAGQVLLDGVAVTGTFPFVQGTAITGINGAVGGAPAATTATPGASGTTATGTATTGSTGTTTAGTASAGSANTPVAPGSQATGRSSGSSHTWIFVAGVVVGAIALGASGFVALRMRRKPPAPGPD